MSDDPLARIEQLEQRVHLLESYVRAVQAKVDTQGEPTTWSAPAQGRPTWPAPEPAPTPEPTRPLFVFDSEVALKWGGVGLVVLAVGFAVSTAISRGWIGPELQLAGALAVSLGLIAAGMRLQPKRPAWTHALCTGGVLALFTTFASNLFLEEANDDVAFVSTAVAGLVGIVLARHVTSEWVAAAAIVGGAIGWAVIADGEPPIIATLVLIVVAGAAAIAVSVEQGWQAVRLVAHAAAMLEILAVAGEAEQGLHQVLVLMAAGLLAASLVRVPSIGDMTSVWQQVEIQLTIGGGPWAFGVIAVALDLEDDSTVGTVAIVVAAGTALAALGLRRWIASAHFVSIVIGASISLSIGLAVLLSTTVAFTALAVQGAGLIVLSRALDRSVRVLINAAVVLGIAGLFVVSNMLDAWVDDVSIGDDISHLAIIVAIAVAAWQSRHLPTQQVGAIAVLTLVLIWFGSVLVHLPQGQAAVSVSWAIIGTIVLVAGAVRRHPEVGAVGLAVLALTVGKLLTVDLQEVDTLWRAGLFFVVGLGFLRLGFLLPRFSDDDEDAD
jgi:uncharacterized membrane protein